MQISRINGYSSKSYLQIGSSKNFILEKTENEVIFLFLKHKAFEHNKIVVDVNEAYTSKTVSWTGEIVKNLGGSKTIKSPSTGQKMDRDLNGARGIFLRALVDTPWLQENLITQFSA